MVGPCTVKEEAEMRINVCFPTNPDINMHVEHQLTDLDPEIEASGMGSTSRSRRRKMKGTSPTRGKSDTAMGSLTGLGRIYAHDMFVPEEEEYKVGVSRDGTGFAGYMVWPDTLQITELDTARPNLKEMRNGDTVIAVNGVLIGDIQDYKDNAVGVNYFMLTLSRGGVLPEEATNGPYSEIAALCEVVLPGGLRIGDVVFATVHAVELGVASGDRGIVRGLPEDPTEENEGLVSIGFRHGLRERRVFLDPSWQFSMAGGLRLGDEVLARRSVQASKGEVLHAEYIYIYIYIYI